MDGVGVVGLVDQVEVLEAAHQQHPPLRHPQEELELADAHCADHAPHLLVHQRHCDLGDP